MKIVFHGEYFENTLDFQKMYLKSRWCAYLYSVKYRLCISNFHTTHRNTIVAVVWSSPSAILHTHRETDACTHVRVSKFYDIHTSRKLNSLVLRFCLWDVDLILSDQFHVENRGICVSSHMLCTVCSVLCLINT